MAGARSPPGPEDPEAALAAVVAMRPPAGQLEVSAPGPEHLLLAATTLPDGTATRALERVGIDPQWLRPAIEAAHASALAAVGIDVEHGPERTAGLRGPNHRRLPSDTTGDGTVRHPRRP